MTDCESKLIEAINNFDFNQAKTEACIELLIKGVTLLSESVKDIDKRIQTLETKIKVETTDRQKEDK